MAKVVIIDDERLMVELLRHALKKAGHRVVGEQGAAEGVAAIRQSRPDVVLLDLEMPVLDGVACLRLIREDPSIATTPVLMMSSHPARDTVLRVASMGVQGVLVKDPKIAEKAVERISRLAPVGEAEPAEAGGAAAGAAEAAPGGAVAGEPARSATVAGAPVGEGPSADEDAESLTSSLLQLDADALGIEQATAALKTLKPLMSRAEVMDRVLKGNELRAMGPAVRSVLQLTQSASSSIESIAKAIKQDQALSLKVLKVANSPLYSRGERVESVSKAVARIGVAEIRSTVLSLSVIDQFKSTSVAGRVKAEWFWEHSLATGLIASRIARLRGLEGERVESLFTAGLLHDVGRMMYAESLGDTYAAVIDTADRLGLPLETVESRLLLVNHADLTDRLLRQWNFSPGLINPIALHHLSVGNARRMAPRAVEDVATLGLANRLAHALLLGCSGNDVVYPLEEFATVLGLTGVQVLEICATAPDQTEDLKIAMLSHGGAGGASLLDETCEALLRPGADGAACPIPRPLYVAAEPNLDAVGILCRRLGAAPAVADAAARDGAPNMIVVRVNHARERAEMLGRLKSAESAEGLANLPTLVIGTGAGCFLAPDSLPGRRLDQVAIPLRLGRLVKAMRELLLPAQAVAAAA